MRKYITKDILRLLGNETFVMKDFVKIFDYSEVQISKIVNHKEPKLGTIPEGKKYRVFTRDEFIQILEIMKEEVENSIKEKKKQNFQSVPLEIRLQYIKNILALLYGDVSIEYIDSLEEYIPSERICLVRGGVQEIEVYLKDEDNNDTDNN